MNHTHTRDIDGNYFECAVCERFAEFNGDVPDWESRLAESDVEASGIIREEDVSDYLTPVGGNVTVLSTSKVRGLSKSVILGNVTDESDSTLIGIAMHHFSETSSSLFGSSVTRHDTGHVTVNLWID